MPLEKKFIKGSEFATVSVPHQKRIITVFLQNKHELHRNKIGTVAPI